VGAEANRRMTPAAVASPTASRVRAHGLQRMVAAAYGLTYDLIVSGFGPYEALVAEVAELVRRSDTTGQRLRILDVSCGTGAVARRLARRGHHVVGIDPVGHLARLAAQRSTAPRAASLAFHHLDVAADPVPGAGTFDVVVSMHTLYWHPQPSALLAGCRRVLRPGGHAVLLTYARPVRVGSVFKAIRASEGLTAAVRALRWLVPTAVFEQLRDCEPQYLTAAGFHETLARADFELLEARRTFLDGISLLAWVRTRAASPSSPNPRRGGARRAASQA
jgi:SAM-dependent methyltransferase